MARRVSWTNNSSGHTGTYVYRAPTLDPQNLPAPVATVDPVAQGATAEWVDNEGLSAGDYDYAVQDFDGQGIGDLSIVHTHAVPADLSTAQIGDEIEGGIYAGTLAYPDGREFHIIFAMQSGEIASTVWGNYGVVTGATDPDDGLANQEEILVNHDDGSAAAFYHCRDYSGGGFNDWYMPASNECQLVSLRLQGHSEFTFAPDWWRWCSTERSSTQAKIVRWNNSFISFNDKNTNSSQYRTRPIRRVAV